MKYPSFFLLTVTFLSPLFVFAQPATHLLADAETVLRRLRGFSYTVKISYGTDHFTSPEIHTGRVTFERKAPRDYPYRFLLDSPTRQIVYDGDRLATKDRINDWEGSIRAMAFRNDCGTPWIVSTQPLLWVTFPELADRLRTWRQSPTATLRVTKESVDGQRCLRVSVTTQPPEGNREHHELYLAIATRLPVRYVRETEKTCGSETLTADFSELVVQSNEPE